MTRASRARLAPALARRAMPWACWPLLLVLGGLACTRADEFTMTNETACTWSVVKHGDPSRWRNGPWKVGTLRPGGTVEHAWIERGSFVLTSEAGVVVTLGPWTKAEMEAAGWAVRIPAALCPTLPGGAPPSASSP